MIPTTPTKAAPAPESLALLDTLIAEERLIRNAWAGKDAKGRETACLLAALAPETALETDAGACPATVMPAWLAHLTPWMDDSGSLAAWPAMVRRYAALARRWHVLSPAQWYRLDYVARAIAVRAAMDATTNESVLAVCRQTAALCDRRGGGEAVTDQEFKEAAEAAAEAAEAAAGRAAAEAAAWRAAAAEAAAEAAEAAAGRAAAAAAAWRAAAAAWRAAEAAEAAAWRAAAAAWRAAEAAEAAAGRAASAGRAAADRITDSILGAIERECAISEAAS
jgi:hypothetical protein